jgi:hypothetical protein
MIVILQGARVYFLSAFIRYTTVVSAIASFEFDKSLNHLNHHGIARRVVIPWLYFSKGIIDMLLSLEDLPQKIQYVIVDSEYVDGSNNAFSVNFDMKSNIHFEGMSRVIGLSVADFYITQVGENTSTNNTNVAKYVDIISDTVPKIAQLLDERNGMVLARVPLERHFGGSSGLVLRDKQFKQFNRKKTLFNPINIKKMNFQINEMQDDGDYVPLQPDARWHMVLEVTTINVKQKPKDPNARILEALYTLMTKLDALNASVSRLPDKEEEERANRKLPFGALVAVLAALFVGYAMWVSKSNARVAPMAPVQYA